MTIDSRVTPTMQLHTTDGFAAHVGESPAAAQHL
jgi:hypothetical protein